MAIKYLDEQSNSPRLKYLDEQQTQSPNLLEDVGRSALSGVTSIPRALDSLSGIAAQAITGKVLPKDSIWDKAEYKPQTFAGKAVNFIGELAPYMAVKSVTMPAQIAIGAAQGLVNSLNNNENPIVGTIEGGATGFVGGGVIKGAGKAFEALQPHISEVLSGVPKEVSRKALRLIKSGKNPLEGQTEDEVMSLIRSPEYFKQAAQNITESEEIAKNELAKTLTEKIDKVKNIEELLSTKFNKQYNILGKKIADILGQTKEKTSNAVNEATWGLTEKEVIPYTKIKDMIEGIKRESYQGADVSPVVNKTTQVLNDAEVDNLIIPALRGKVSLDELYGYETLLKKGATLEDLDINPSELSIKPANLNQFKKEIDMKINWQTESKSVNDFLKQIRRQPASLLEQSSDEFRNANKIHSDISDFLKENSWLNTPESIARKLASTEKDSGELADTIGKVRQLQSLLPDNTDISKELEALLKKQSLSSKKIASTLERLKNEAQSQRENITSGTQYQKEALLKDELKNKDYQKLIKQAKDKPLDVYKETHGSMDEIERAIRGLAQRNMLGSIGRVNKGEDALIPIIHGGLGTYSIASLLHGNPFPLLTQLSVALQSSPKVQNKILKLYTGGSKTSPYYTRIAQQAINNLNRDDNK